MSSINPNSKSVAPDHYMNRCIDVDSHEMAPIHAWPELFGDSAKEFVDLCVRMELMNNHGVNTMNRPDIERDCMAINEQTVWRERGPSAPGAFDLDRRLEVMDVMGVERQLMFPGYGFTGTVLALNPLAHEFFGFDPSTVDALALADRAIRGHNDWCLRQTKRVGSRIRPVALLLTNSLDQMMRDAERLLDSGARAVQIPNGSPPANMSPADAELDPFWRLFASANVPITFHIGAEFPLLKSAVWDRNVPAFVGAQTLELTIQPFWGATVNFATENFLAAMILGGVFERHPNLRVGSIEIGAQWVGPLSERLDLWAAQFAPRMRSILSMKPSEYMNRQLRAAPFYFEDVASYFERYPHLQDVYCFATDYPHIEGGRETKHKFSDGLARSGDTVRRKFFRENGLLLLPD
jgi:predicted TIM-barrel fold metal-dependent hydrolase